MLRCGVVDAPKKWKWGSYNAYAYGIDDGITDFHPFYFTLAKNPGGRKLAYRKMIKEQIGGKYKLRSPVLSRGLIVGTLRFVKEIIDEYVNHSFYIGRKIFISENTYNISRIGDLVGEV